MNLTLAVEGASDLLEQGLAISEEVNDIFGRYWLEVFTSELYANIDKLAVTFAAGCLLFFMMRFVYAAVHEGDYREPLRSLIWPIIVVTLLSNNGQLLGQMTREIRNELNSVAVQTLKVNMLSISLEEAVRGAMAKGAVTAEISAQIAQCQTLLGQEQIACLQAANAQVQSTVNDFRDHWLVEGALAMSWLDEVATGIQGAVEYVGDSGPSDSGGFAGQVLGGFMGGFLGSQTRSIIQGFLMAWQWAFVNLIQISLLLTGIMGPIAVAASLLPFGGRPIFTWLTGFLALGFAQIMYNIIVGLAAVVILNANIYDINGFLVLVAILAPALALGLAAGGGLAIFNIMLSGSSGMATLLVSRVGSMGYGSYR